MKPDRIRRALVIWGAFLFGILPVAAHLLAVGGVPGATGPQTRAAIEKALESAALVDVRSPEDFSTRHILGSVNWPYEALVEARSPEDVPVILRGRTLYLLCEAGFESARAARVLEKHLGIAAVNVTGGLEVYGQGVPQGSLKPLESEEDEFGSVRPLPVLALSGLDQFLATAAAFFVKPLYMTGSLILISLLWRKREPDLAALRWGLVFFLAGESFCAVNYLFFGEDSLAVEYLHIYGMVLAFGFTTFAIIEALDDRLLKLADSPRPCAALAFCGSCPKAGGGSCRGLRLMSGFSVLAAALAFAPLSAPLNALGWNTEIYGAIYYYAHPVSYEVFELVYAPLVALVLFLAAAVILYPGRAERLFWGKALVSGGAGFLGFSFFRMVFFGVFQNEPHLGVIWEEITELMYVAGAAWVLYLFRKTLLRPAPKEEAS